MTGAQHTPGPWQYHYSSTSPDEWIVGAEGFAPIVAFVTSDDEQQLSGAEVEANARLIVIAPELLAYAKKMVDYSNDSHYAREAETLVAKAEGRDP